MPVTYYTNCLTFLGTLQVFVFPMVCPGGTGEISLALEFFYGFTLWSGIAVSNE